MRHKSVGTGRQGPRRTGLTVLEILIIIAIIAVLVWFFLLRSRGPKPLPAREVCARKLLELYKGLEAYWNGCDGYFPVAWHVGGTTVADDLSNIAYYRFAIRERRDPTFNHVVSQQDIERNGGDLLAARKEKYESTFQFWKCPVKGWTDDYFAPEIIFRMPQEPGAPAGAHARYSQVVEGVSAAERPVLADVNASFPDPEAKLLKDPGHMAEMRKGFSIVSESDLGVFVGVGPSLRVAGVASTSRFDFRHEGSVNILFLDGHADAISKTDNPRLQRVHECWNGMIPGEGR